MVDELRVHPEKEDSIFRSILECSSEVVEGLFDNYLKTNRLRNVVLDKVRLDFSLFEHEDCELTLIVVGNVEVVHVFHGTLFL